MTAPLAWRLPVTLDLAPLTLIAALGESEFVSCGYENEKKNDPLK
jgi:hypothetical protein